MKKLIAALFVFITVGSAFAQQLGTPTPLQRILNELPAIPIAGRNLKFQFGGTTWIATVNGENVLAGTVESVDINGGSILTLKQTHVWAAAAGRAVGGLLGGAVGGAVGSVANMWVTTPGPEIVLDYNNSSPRATLSVASNARIAEARAAGTRTAGTGTTVAPQAMAGAAGIPQQGIREAETLIAAANAAMEARAAETRLAEALVAAETKAAAAREAERLAAAARSAANPSESNIRLAEARAAEARAAETLAVAEARMAEARAIEAREMERRATAVAAPVPAPVQPNPAPPSYTPAPAPQPAPSRPTQPANMPANGSGKQYLTNSKRTVITILIPRAFGTMTDGRFGLDMEFLNINGSLFPFFSLGAGLGAGMTFNTDGVAWNWAGIKIFAGLTLPLFASASGVRLYGDVFSELGYSAWGGINPGFEMGLQYGEPDSIMLEVSYGTTYYRNNRLKHFIGIAWRGGFL